MYDLEIALLIAQQSQKDPREYLPYLQTLQGLPPLRRQFQIDNDLRRYSQAIRHLYDLDDFDELLIYTENHELYGNAIELYKYRDDCLRKLMSLHAAYLVVKNKPKEAGISKSHPEYVVN
jgi:elongator complex protein 1